MIETDISNIWGSIDFSGLMAMEERLVRAHDTLAQGKGPGRDFLGWHRLPERTTEAALDAIVAAAQKIRSNSQALVVVGIGGSYLGARAAIEFMNGTMHNEKDPVKIYFAGNHLSARALVALVEQLENVDFSVNIVSKSGSTMETAVAARMFRWMLNRKYGAEGARERIYVTTDPEKGRLRALAEEEGYETFPIPSNVGGAVQRPHSLRPAPHGGGGHRYPRGHGRRPEGTKGSGCPLHGKPRLALCRCPEYAL